MTLRVVGAVAAVAIVLVYALGSGRYVATNTAWYLSLEAPPWQPPNAVFGLAWTYNFIVLGIVGVLMALRAEARIVTAYLIVFALSVVLALAWSYLFYEPHQLMAAAVALSLCALATVPMVVLAFVQQPLLGWLLIPYQLWLVIASSLSWGYWALNRIG